MRYASNVGLEVHVQLKTRSKMFCGCGTGFGAPPNTHVCPVCLGYPGAMPVINGEAVRLTVLTGLMIGSRIRAFSKFDRKSYFYPDMPKNYQISQYDMPLCEGGSVEYDLGGARRRVRIVRIHLEEDVGKSMHFAASSGVDFNRAGVPLMEIVTEPDLATPDDAFAFLQALKRILLYAGVSDGNLEEGNIRCDVNCSVRPEGREALGTKAELKNLNTFKGVRDALHFEIERQAAVLDGGGTVRQETRRWDADAGETYPMRSKEDAHDYRYFPEPDLPPVVLAPADVEAWRAQLPEMPDHKKARFIAEFGIPEYDAGVIGADRAVADFFEAAARQAPNAKAVSNWVMTELLRLLAEEEKPVTAIPLRPEALARLVTLTETGVLNSNSAKEVFAVLFREGGDPEAIVRARGLAQVSDSGELERWVAQAMADHPKVVEDFRKGKTAAAKFLMGQVMRMSRGKANPQQVTQILESRLAGG